VIFVTENSNKLQKNHVLEGKISGERTTLEGLPFNSSTRKLGCAFGILEKISMNMM
jgi:hypothetical protein